MQAQKAGAEGTEGRGNWHRRQPQKAGRKTDAKQHFGLLATAVSGPEHSRAIGIVDLLPPGRGGGCYSYPGNVHEMTLRIWIHAQVLCHVMCLCGDAKLATHRVLIRHGCHVCQQAVLCRCFRHCQLEHSYGHARLCTADGADLNGCAWTCCLSFGHFRVPSHGHEYSTLIVWQQGVLPSTFLLDLANTNTVVPCVRPNDSYLSAGETRLQVLADLINKVLPFLAVIPTGPACRQDLALGQLSA